MRSFLLLAAALAGPAAAQAPGQFAWQWPVQTSGSDGAYTLVLDEAVYARLARDDLRDLMVFNADNQPVPFAPLPQLSSHEQQRQALNWMRVAAVAGSAPAGDTFSLRLERDTDGTVRDLQIDSSGAAGTPPSPDLLVDLGPEPLSVSSLRLTLAAEALRPVNLRVQVLASDDLAQWRLLADGLALVSLVDNGLTIERLRLDFDPSRERYLRLALAPGGDWPALARIESERSYTGVEQPALREVVLEGQPVPGQPGTFDYPLPGPLPIEGFDVELASTNTVAQAQLQSRAAGADENGWRSVDALTLFRLGSGGDEVRQLPGRTSPDRDRQWRLQTTPALAQAPTLRLSYRPDRFVMLAQEPAPYRLLAGSVQAQRPDYPVQAALAAARASRASNWEPPLATLGTGAVAAGDVALAPDRGPEYRRWALWAVLAIGGLVVLMMSLRVLKQPPPQ